MLLRKRSRHHGGKQPKSPSNDPESQWAHSPASNANGTNANARHTRRKSGLRKMTRSTFRISKRKIVLSLAIAALLVLLAIMIITEKQDIAVFYNVFTETNDNVTYVKTIVNEQLSYRRPQHKVFVRSIGTPFDIVNTTQIQHDEKGDEPETLHLLWKYCQDHPWEKVVYIHSKGSFHRSENNDRLRKFLTRGALSQQCAHLPWTCNVCSSRMSPIPHPHTSGNMWLARCNYVKKLIDPLEFAVRMDDVQISAEWATMNQTERELQYPCGGKGRFAAEHWIHSHPTVMPCDLAMDDTFVWNYDNIPDENFEMDLRPAPRFDLRSYDIVNNTCQKYGFIEEDRLNEYQVLYGKKAPRYWWGWKIYSQYHSEQIAIIEAAMKQRTQMEEAGQ